MTLRRWNPAGLLVVLFCVGQPACISVDQPFAVDDDGDGFSEFEGDCDDDDADTYPGAAYNESAEDCMTDADGDG